MDRLRKLQTVAELLSNILLLHAMVLNSKTIGVKGQRKFSSTQAPATFIHGHVSNPLPPHGML